MGEAILINENDSWPLLPRAVIIYDTQHVRPSYSATEKPTRFYDRSISLLREKSRKRFRQIVESSFDKRSTGLRSSVFRINRDIIRERPHEMRVTDPLDRSSRDKRSSCISDTAVISDGETERITITNRF
jgi:hypothetical protein